MTEIFMGDDENCPNQVRCRTEEEDAFCAICYDSVADEASIAIPCNHTYCTDCIDHWLSLGRSDPSCPLCMGYILCLVPVSATAHQKMGLPYIITRDGQKYLADEIIGEWKWPPPSATEARHECGLFVCELSGRRTVTIFKWMEFAVHIVTLVMLVLLFVLCHYEKYI